MSNDLTTKQSTSLQTLEGRRAEVLRLKRELDDLASREELIAATERIISSYPNARPADPQGYVDAMVAHLARYPRSMLARICDPQTGIVTQCTFPPTVAEIDTFAGPMLNALQGRFQTEKAFVKQIEAREWGPSDEERAEIGQMVKDFAESMKHGEVPEGASHARKMHMPEWMWDEDEQSAEFKAMQKRFARSQCAPGEAIRAHLRANEPVTDANEPEGG